MSLLRERLRRINHLLTYAGLVSGFIIIAYFYYITITTYEVPIGWDTASYLAEAKVLRLYGFSRFLSNYNGQSFLYALILGILDILGIDVILLVKIVPFVAIITIIILSNKIARMDSDLSGLLVIPFSIHWFTIIRFSSDLHRSLLSLIGLMFVWSYFPAFIKCKPRSHLIMSFSAILLISFIQIEFSLLLVTVIVLGILLKIILVFRKNKNIVNLTGLLKVIIITSSLVIPAFSLAISYSNYFLGLSYPVPLPIPLSREVLNNFYFPLLPFTTLGFIISVRKAEPIHLFTVSLTTIVILGFLFACLPFYTPFRLFITRLSYLFPMPILVSIGLSSILKLFEKFYIIIVSKSEFSEYKMRIQLSTLVSIIVVLLVFVAPLSHTMEAIKTYWRPFISSATFNNLKVIASDTHSSSIPIFIIYTEDGITAYMYNNWITALVGRHYTYLGSLYEFLALVPTNFSDVYATKWCQAFLEELIQAGIISPSAFCNYSVFLITDMYNKPLSREELRVLTLVSSGLYSLNCSSIPDLLRKFVIVAATDFTSHSGEFYISSHESWPYYWQTYNQTLKLYVENPKSAYEVNFTRFIFINGLYNVSIRYLDASDKCVLRLKVDNSIVASWTYTGTHRPIEKQIVVPLKKGYITISVEIEGENRLYLNLDYLSFTLINGSS